MFELFHHGVRVTLGFDESAGCRSMYAHHSDVVGYDVV